MRICLIDIDGHNYPNLALMKLSAWHKARGDTVELTSPLEAFENGRFNAGYASKVFTFTPMPELPEWVEVGGSGADLQKRLPDEIEHLYMISQNSSSKL